MSRKTILPNIAYDSQRRSYYVTIRRPAPPDGAPRRTVQCYPTLELAIQALDRKGGEEILAQGEDLEKLTLGQWLSYWLEQIIKPSRSASTAHGYTMIIRNHLSPSLGSTQLSRACAPTQCASTTCCCTMPWSTPGSRIWSCATYRNM